VIDVSLKGFANLILGFRTNERLLTVGMGCTRDDFHPN
jgi:hypothetical protein